MSAQYMKLSTLQMNGIIAGMEASTANDPVALEVVTELRRIVAERVAAKQRKVGSKARVRYSGELVTIAKIIEIYAHGESLYLVRWDSGRDFRFADNELIDAC